VKIGPALEHLHGTEADLAKDLRTIAERHAADHDVYHVGLMLADRCDQLLASLEPFAEAYGQHVDADTDVDAVRSFAERVRRATSAALGRSERTGLLLLRDLRELFLEANEAQIDWTIVRQGALAVRDRKLVTACDVGLFETERVVRWLKTRIKETAPQVMAT
jgi:hypothetical protein